MAKQIYNFTDITSPDKTNVLLIEPSDGASTHKISVEDLLELLPTITLSLINAADDSAADSAGVEIGGLYRNGSIVMIRVS
jgi:hypothetical protein